MERKLRINLTETGESVMLPLRKVFNLGDERTIWNYSPRKCAPVKGVFASPRMPSQLCRGLFVSIPSVSISHNRDFSQVHLSSGKSLQTNCNVQFSSSEWRKQLGQRPTPDDLDLHHFQKSIPPNDQISIRDGSVRRARLIPFPYFGSQLISCKLKMQGIKA